jgi:hypothetical protein
MVRITTGTSQHYARIWYALIAASTPKQQTLIHNVPLRDVRCELFGKRVERINIGRGGV